MVGWNYRLVGVPDPIVTANLRWLAGYRHPRHDLPDVREVLRRVFVTPTPLMAGTAAAGDPIAVLPAAREWERHVVEIETGLPPGAEPGVAPKPEYDPTSTTVVDRDRAKAAELGVGVRTVHTPPERLL